MIEIVMKPIGDLHVYERNARTHSEAQVLQIMESIKEYGWTNPVLADEADVVIAGHGRLLAARRLQLVEVPTIILQNIITFVKGDPRRATEAVGEVQFGAIETDPIAEQIM